MTVELSKIASTAVATVLAWLVMVPSCQCNDTTAPAPDASTSASVAPAPTPTPTVSVKPVASWEPVLKLGAVHGWWGQGEGEETPKGPWADIRSRKVAQASGARWELPYPWQIDIKVDEYGTTINCGFYTGYQDSGDAPGWRVAYCIDGPYPTGKRTADRIYFHTKKKEAGKGKLLRVRIGKVVSELSRDLP